eukprot:scaffold107436_cov24-Phaeocystis_antarctica.AAC.1
MVASATAYAVAPSLHRKSQVRLILYHHNSRSADPSQQRVKASLMATGSAPSAVRARWTSTSAP